MASADLAGLMRTPTPSAGMTEAAAVDDPAKVKQAAREFEAIWLEQMLHSARPSDESSLSGEADSTRDMVLDMADQQVARMLAAQGGLGLAAMVQSGLKKPVKTAAPE